MKKLYIVANWKSYKTIHEAETWLKQVKQLLSENQLPKEKILILCVPFTLLPFASHFIKENNMPLFLGSQDLSPFGMGAYTGEVNAQQVKEFADFTLVGHSERRRYFDETDEILSQKVGEAIKQAITPILCVTDKTTPIPQTITIVGYEPVAAIGSGQPDTPENANTVATYIKEQNAHVSHVLYGGSVIPENVSTFTSQKNIDGVIIGGASLDAKKLFALCINA